MMATARPGDGRLRLLIALCTCVVSVFHENHTFAAVLRVPHDYPTIQTALDATAAGDTVSVGWDTYAEALIGPPHSFALFGDVGDDTTEESRPTISPPQGEGDDTSACLLLGSSPSCALADLRFVNGPWMYPREPAALDLGGVRFTSSGEIRVVRCTFDSTTGGISPSQYDLRPRIDVRQSVFRDVAGGCVHGLGPLTVIGCHVTGTQYAGYYGRDSTLIESCQFDGVFVGGWVTLVVSGPKVVRNCLFGPGTQTSYWQPMFRSRTHEYLELSGNVFQVLGLATMIADVVVRTADTVLISVNLFEGNMALPDGAGAVFRISESPSERAESAQVTIEGNLFERNMADEPTGDIALWLTADLQRSPLILQRNLWLHNMPESGVSVNIRDSMRLHTFHDNVFIGNGVALVAMGDPADTLDARWNYWGAETGPRSPENPEGTGDEVRGPVLFDPWYPDTSFVTASEPGVPAPEQFALKAYPNPFNASVTLELEVAKPGIVRVELFDLLGRKAAEVWRGAITERRKIRFDASGLSSGIYFARAWSPIGRRNLATTKIVLIR
ncbi:T9SS type A sorting domain-containing protein [candidate division KSB1 bacterium]|nr:T9SS type A sorting domain-containing protein [candidate division KSB1 bacterium]